MAVAEHDVTGLKIAVKEIIASRAQQELGEAAEVIFQSLLIEWDAGELEKIILKVIQVPGD